MQLHQHSPQHLALIEGDTQITYGQLHTEITQYTCALHTIGVQAGDKVGVLCANSSASVALIHAIWGFGATLVPLNTRLTAPELDYQLTVASCRILITDNSTQALAQTLTAHRITYPIQALPTLVTNADPPPLPRLTADTPCAIVFTSGTSGKPKGAILTHGNFEASARGSAERIGHYPDDHWLCVLPFYHVGGLSLIYRCARDGMTLELMPKFDAESLNHRLLAHPITLVSLVPTMLYRMLALKPLEQPYQALRLVLLGGAAASVELLQQAQAHGVPIATTYGLTEACSQVCTALMDTVTRKVGTVGKPLAGTQVRVVDEHGQTVANGIIGEIVVQSATVMQGYLDNPEATAKAIRDGWLFTGDMGYIDEDGDLWVVQRRSDLIVSGGENIYPSEIEALLRQHPAIAEAVAVGLPDPEWGQRVALMILPHPNAHLTADDVQAFVQGKLARYKQPRLIRIVESLPLTASGKIHRARIIEELTT